MMIWGTKQLRCILVMLLVDFGFIACEKYYITPSRSDPCTIEHCLTLSQFAANSTHYLTNDTTLIFAPGNHSLESDFIVENVRSFSMFSESTSLPNHAVTVIACIQYARVQIINAITATVSGFEFVGCVENRVESVDRFQLKDSGFQGQATVNGTALIVNETNTTLDGAYFISNAGNEQEESKSSPLIITGAGGAIMSVGSSITITQSWFEGNSGRVGGAIYSEHTHITIFNSTFYRNHAFTYGGAIYTGNGSTVDICDCNFVQNSVLVLGGVLYIPYASHVTINIIHSQFIANINNNTQFYGFGAVCSSSSDNLSITVTYSKFFNNDGFSVVDAYSAGEFTIVHSEFKNNNAYHVVRIVSATKVTIAHNDFIKNNVKELVLVFFSGVPFQNLCNKFMENGAMYDVYVGPFCKAGYSTSLGSSRCIKCPGNWHLNLIGIVIAAFVASIVLVIFMLALNMTVAVGTLNGILFYANIVFASADTYLPFSSPNFVTVLISWLNLDIGFDICFFEGMNNVDRPLIQLIFPAYVMFLVVMVIIISVRSSKFAKLIGRGNPVAVLATMILLSYTKLLNAIFAGSVSMLYGYPSYGSRNFDVTRITEAETIAEIQGIRRVVLIVFTAITFLLGAPFTVLIFSWQWLLRYQDKAICKCVRYQKLQHFFEPYFAPYTLKYRYWTGLLLLVRILLMSVSALNFTRDPQQELLSTVLVVGFLILMKGVTAKRIYTEWPVDVMETVMYFSLVAFAAFTSYTLKSGGNQTAVAYTSCLSSFWQSLPSML